jgi:ribosomal protein L20
MSTEHEKQTLDKILQKLDRIEVGFYGDEKNEFKGVVSRMKEVEAYIEEDRRLKQKIGGAIWIIGAIWTALTTFTGWIVSKM